MKIIILFLSCVILVTTKTLDNTTVSSSSLLDEKIVGGKPAVPRTMKYMASLKINQKHFCGGCLISKVHVLSSAQCVNIFKLHGGINYVNASVLLGTTRLLGLGIKRMVARSEYHPNFKPSNPLDTSAFDIGLILLAEAVLDESIASEILFSDTKIIPKISAVVAGWGYEEISSPNVSSKALEMSPILKKLDVIFLHHHRCQGYYKSLTIIIKEFQVCAGASKDRTTTWGDIGGPVVKDRKLLGIISHVSTSTKKYYPTLIIKLSSLENYINAAKSRLTHDLNIDEYLGNHANSTQ